MMYFMVEELFGEDFSIAYVPLVFILNLFFWKLFSLAANNFIYQLQLSFLRFNNPWKNLYQG